MNTPEQNQASTQSAPVQSQPKAKPFVCPVDPAELEQCDSCQ